MLSDREADTGFRCQPYGHALTYQSPTILPHVEPHVSSDAPPSDACVHRESLAAFLEFAAEAVGIAHRRDGGVLNLAFEHREHPAWPRPYHMQVAVDEESIAQLGRKVASPADGAQWLWHIATIEHGALLGRPDSQPESVHEFSSRLFDAYVVDGGQTHLSGCHLTEVPFLRVTLIEVNAPDAVVHHFLDAEGHRVSEELIADLGLASVVPLASQATAIMRSQVQALLQHTGDASDRFLAATVVSAKRAQGAVQFEIGEQCARVTFDDWTRTLNAPPFHCAASGLDSYHLAAIDDGRIVAAEAIAICEQSGARVLSNEMVTCAATGKRVDPRLIAECPISSRQILETELVPCAACQQRVSREVLAGGVCQACRELPAARVADTWVAGLAEQFPSLTKFRKFRAGEAGGVVRMMAVGIWQRILVVTPAGSTDPIVVAMRRGFAGKWQQIPREEWGSVLGAVSKQATDGAAKA